MAVALVCLALLAALLAGGCGMQTDEANKDLTQANAHQAEAEAVMARLKALPTDWQNVFASGVTPATVASARQLVQAREADLDALDKALKAWSQDMTAITKLNVDDKIKEYVKLKLGSIKHWQDYSLAYLRPLVKGYGGLVETIALGRPATEQQKAASDLTNLTSESIGKLEECLNAEKQADSYFKANKLGK
jgi:hypothetical protein